MIKPWSRSPVGTLVDCQRDGNDVSIDTAEARQQNDVGSLGVSLGSRRVEGVTVPVSAGVSELDSLRQVRVGCKKGAE